MAANPEIPGYDDLVPVGRGGYAVVYRARQKAVGRQVALKVLTQVNFDPSATRRFLEECRSLGALSWHPNIVVVFDAGVTPDDTPYLALEYLEGGSLADRLTASGPMPWADVLEIGVHVASALGAAHGAGVIHRDLKPENILIGHFGEPKLCDFGIAISAGLTKTTTGIIVGTVAHAAPEVFAGTRATEQADIYSLGSTLFALLTGEAPFVREGDESLLAIAVRTASEPPPDLRTHGVPEVVASVIEGALAKDPAARPQGGAAMGEELRQAQIKLGIEPTTLRTRPGPILRDPPRQRALQPTQVVRAVPVVTAPVETSPEPDRRTWYRRFALVALIVLAIAAVAFLIVRGNSKQSRAGSHVLAGDSSTSTALGSQTTITVASGGSTTAPASSIPGATGVPGAPGGNVSPTVAPPNPPPTGTTSPVAVTVGNRPPVIAAGSIANRTDNEMVPVSLTVVATDPDGGPITYQVTGLPAGVVANGNHISGIISPDAATVTNDRRVGILASSFPITVVATDQGGLTDTRQFTWTVRDTYTRMPNYIGRFGDGTDGLPDIAALSTPLNDCAFDSSTPFALGAVWRQGVAPNTVVAWGQTIHFWFWDAGQPPPCSNTPTNTPKGW